MSCCRSCEASVVWAHIESTGKPHPFDAETSEKGSWRLERRPPVEGSIATRVVAVHVPERDRRPGEKLYVSHFATCPNRRAWAKRAAVAPDP